MDNDTISLMKKIQENLMNLSDDSFGDSKLFFLNNFVFDNKKDINAFFRAFIIALAYQPSSKLILLKLINEIIDCIPSPNIALFKIELMSTVFNLPGPTSSGLFLLYHLLEKSFFTQSEIIGQIRKYRFYNIKKKSNLMLCYIWFSPEIYKENFNFYSMLKEDCSKYAQIYPNDHLVSYFVKNETELIQNDFEMIKKFRKNGHNHDYLYLLLANDDITSLQYVAAQPDFNYNRKILPSFFEICPFAQNSPSLIEVAALYGSINCFKYLLLNGSSLYLLDETNASLPQYAVAGGNLEIIRICHQKKLSFNGTSQIAALFHRNDILNWLLEDEGQEIESCIKNRGTVIQNAATTNNIIIIEQCIENDVDVNDGTLNRTSLHISCELGNIESVMLLLSADNVNLNACRWNGTALYFAAENRHKDIVELLLNKPGINVNAGNTHIGTPLRAAAENGSLDILKMLLSANDINVNYDCTNFPPLLSAVENNHIEIVRELLKCKEIDVNHECQNGTSLYIAAKNGYDEIVRILLMHKNIKVNVLTKGKYSPLYIAALNQNLNCVRLLCSHEDINVNIRNKIGETPLHAAASKGDIKMVNFLLSCDKIDTDPMDDNGLTPYILASNKYYFQIANILRPYIKNSEKIY